MSMDRTTIGPILKKKREAKELTIRQVAKKLSVAPGTISNIERGLPNVSEEKFIDYAKFLGIEEELFGIVSEEKKKERKYEERLEELEYIASINPVKTITYLDAIQNDIISGKQSKLITIIRFLKGICYFNSENWSLATENFLQVINFVKGSKAGSLKKMNILSASYNYLAVISYFNENNLIKALELTQKGIDSFVLDGKRINQYYLLLMNKPIYLEEMYANEKALQATKDLEEQVFSLETSDMLTKVKSTIFIQIHDLYATIYSNLGLQEEALLHAFKGVKMAWLNKKYDRLFSLWTTIGKIYNGLGKIKTAKTYYQLALDIEKKVENEKHLSFAYTSLSGMLLKEENWKKSKEFALKAVKISKDNPRRLLYTKALISLGKWYINQAEYNHGLEILKIADEISHKHQFENERISIVADICTCYNGLNDHINYTKYTALLHLLITNQKGGEINARTR